jgi:hypothetical protein
MLNSPAGARGAAYFEGSFAAGLPNGVVRVEQPGEALRWREYRAGNDVGRAEATSNGDLFSTGSAAQGLQP